MPRWLIPLAAACVSIVTFAAFLPALNGEFLDWDDTDNFLENPHYRGLGPDQLRWMFTTFHMGHYQPLTWLTLGLDYELWKMKPWGYHLTNNLLHAINAALLFFIALRLLSQSRTAANTDLRQSPSSPLGALGVSAVSLPAAAAVAALLWGLHPLRVESVAWITERRDLLSAFFLLLTVLAYLRATAMRGMPAFIMLMAAWLLFLCATTSKVIVVTLPLVLLVLDWYPLGRLGRATTGAAAARPTWRQAWLGPIARRAWLEKIPFFAISLAFGVNASLGQQKHNWLYTLQIHPLPGRIAQSFYGVVFYLGQAIWPAKLIPIYEIRTPIDPFEARFALSAVLVLAIAAVLVLLRRSVPALIAAAAAFVIFLAPVSGLMQNGPQIAADRYTYLPLMGLAILIGGLAAKAWSSERVARATKVGLAALAAAVIAVLGSLTWQQCRIWHSTPTLWAYAVGEAPDSSVARNGHGYMLMQQGRFDEALVNLREAVRLQPSNPTPHINILNLLERRGDTPEQLIAAYRETLRILPDYTVALYRLGKTLVEQEQYAEAAEQFRAVLARESKHANAHLGLAIALMKQGDWEGSIRHNELAVLADPEYPRARYNLAEVLRVVGREEDAIFHLREALRFDPNYTDAKERLNQLLDPKKPAAMP